VIERLSGSSDAKVLFEKLWLSANATSSAISPVENFFNLLAKDPLWQTIVSEAIDNEHSWRDLFNDDFFEKGASLKDWFRSFLEKIGGKEHPAARALTAATLGFSLVVGVKVLGPTDTLTIPVAVVPTYDHKSNPITLKVDTDPVKVSLTALPTSTDIPVQLRLIPDEKPVRINFVSDGQLKGDLTDGLVEITKKLGTTNASLQQAASNLKLIAAQPVHTDLAGLNKTLAGVEQNIFASTVQLTEANKKLADLKSTYETQSEMEALNSRDEVQDINQRLRILTRASTYRRDAIQVVLPESPTPSVVVLPYLDASSGQQTSKGIPISVGNIVDKVGDEKKELQIALTIVPENVDQKFTKGEVFNLKTVPWSFTVGSIEKHWYGRNSVTLTFTPESSKFLSGNAELLPAQPMSPPPAQSDLAQQKLVPAKLAENQ
jgi:hypothetical protein